VGGGYVDKYVLDVTTPTHILLPFILVSLLAQLAYLSRAPCWRLQSQLSRTGTSSPRPLRMV
jgi:hypothetical protein